MNTKSQKFIADVKDGKAVFRDRNALDLWLSFLDGKEVEVIIGKKLNNRTTNENDYYWGVIVEMLGEYLGYDKDDMHELLKLQHNSKIVNVKGKEVRIPKSTARLNVQEFEDYCERIRRWAATEFQFVIPLPNEINL